MLPLEAEAYNTGYFRAMAAEEQTDTGRLF